MSAAESHKHVTMKINPLAELFPQANAEDFETLKKDISNRGQLHPIVMHGDTLIDGRQRLRACQELNIEPKFAQFAELDLKCAPEDYIWSENMARRNMTEDQRAAVAKKFDEVSAEAAKRSKRNLKRGTQKIEWADSPIRGKRSREILAQRANVSEYKIRQAERLAKHDPAALEKVIAAEMSMVEANKQVDRVTSPQKKKWRVRENLRFSPDIGDVVEDAMQRTHFATAAISRLSAPKYSADFKDDYWVPPSDRRALETECWMFLVACRRLFTDSVVEGWPSGKEKAAAPEKQTEEEKNS